MVYKYTPLFNDAFVVNMMVLLYMRVAPPHTMWRYYYVKLESLNCSSCLVTLVCAFVGRIVMNTRCSVVWWSQNVPDMKIFVSNTALNIFFQQLAKLLLTSILGANVQPSVTIRLPALPHVTRHFLCVRLTLPIEKKYCTTLPAWAQYFTFGLPVAIYMVIAAALLTPVITAQ